MTRAGEEAWNALYKNYPDVKTITVLIGPDNNGGDGYICESKVGFSLEIMGYF